MGVVVRLLSALVALCLLSGTAKAVTLQVDVTGDPGAGSTVWTFSGFAVATGDGAFGIGNSAGFPFIQSQFLNLGDFTDLNLALFDDLVGSASITVESASGGATVSRNIATVMVDTDGNGLDDIGFGLEDNEVLGFEDRDRVSWSGSVQVIGLDILNLSEALLPVTLSAGASGLGLAALLDLELSITEIPLPAGLPLLLAGLGVLGLQRRRRFTRILQRL
ncbi:MAG: VPLPA-CTERM sorting domain-containing protein [Pseudomonadota bacterium]